MAKMRKAWLAALIAGLTSVATALGDDAINSGEWITAVTAFVVALGAVWGIPNQVVDE